MQLGTALHSAILEGKADYYTRPETYAKIEEIKHDGQVVTTITGPEKKWNSNATECREWIEAHQDKPILTATEAAFVAESCRYVRNHRKVKNYGLLRGGKAEVSVFATIKGRKYKGRFDYYNPKKNIIADLKSVADASSRGFFNAVMNFGWHLQAALYQSLAFAATGVKPDFYWIALEKGELPLVSVRKFGLSAELLGSEALDRALATLDACEASNVWPEYADDMEAGIKALEVPEWALAANTQPEELTINGISIIV
jgi:hypothetical protein